MSSSKKCDYRWRAVETMEGLRVYTVCVTHDKESVFRMVPCEEDSVCPNALMHGDPISICPCGYQDTPKVDAVVSSILGHMELKKYPLLEEDPL